MASLDQRTKSDCDIHDIDVAEYCTEQLPKLLLDHGELAARGLRHLKLPPLALEVDGDAYTFLADGDTIVVRAGVDADATHVVLDQQSFSDLVQEVLTATALTTARTADIRTGSATEFNDWDIVLRAMIDGRAVHEPGTITFQDRDGAPLDLERSFALDDDDAEMAHFLAEAGFLHLRGWFDAAEMDVIADDIDRALPTYTPDDGRSWWATLDDGTDRCVRLQHFVEHSPTTADLLDDPRYLRIAGLADDGYRRPPIEGNVIEALVKPIGVVRGISDLPWHKDCSIGRHSYRCSGMTVGISVTGGDERSGRLSVVAGSHRASISHQLRPDLDLPIVPLPTETGDMTVHLSCTLHHSQAPTARERKVMYTGFGLPPRPGDTGAGADRLSKVRENVYKTTDRVWRRLMLERDMLAPHGLAKWAAIDPDQIALEHVDGQSLTYAELDRDGRSWASALQRIGVDVGTHVATLLPNIFDAHRTMLGLAWLRAVEIPLNTGYTGRMLEYTLEYSDTEVLVTTTTFLDQVRQISPRLPALRTVVVVDDDESASKALTSVTDRVQLLARDEFLTGCSPAVDLPGPEVWDTACLLFTSGTTGPSKAVINPWGLVVQMCSWFPADTLAPRDGMYSAMPLFHNSGRSQFNYVVTHGARFVIRDKFSATNVWDDVRKTNCTTLCLVGPLTSLLYAAPPCDDDATTPVRNVLLGPMIPDMEGFEKRFNVRVCTCYGQTEIGSPVATPWEHGPWANCGRARDNWPFHEVRLVDDHDQPVPTGQTGEMIVRCPEPWSLNLGYYKMPDKTVEAWRNGWFHTGDVFRQDEDGWYYFVDRLNDAIRRRGENISSFEVENYVVGYDEVADCTAIGIRTEHGDEEVMACVIVQDPETFDPAALIKYLEPDMPRFMLPRYVQVLDDFPRNETTGRVRKNELRDKGITETTWDREAQG